jgi:hypothetical protein
VKRQLPDIVKAEIELPMLKYSPEPILDHYATEVFQFVNKSYAFEGDGVEDFTKIKKYLATCEITGDEFMIAMNAVSSQKLLDKAGKPITYIRDVNEGNFNLYVSAYLDFKRSSKQYEIGKERLNEFLNPQKDPTPEEQKENRKAWFTAEFERLKKGETVLGSTRFFDMITAKEEIKMNVADVAVALAKFNPEKSMGKTLEGLPNIKKNDVVTFFKDKFVAAYIKKHNLKELPLQDWINYWEKFAI